MGGRAAARESAGMPAAAAAETSPPTVPIVRRLALAPPAPGADATRVVLAHGRRLVRAGVRVLLECEAHIAVVGEATTGEEALDLVRCERPDVVVVDTRLPGLDCVETTRQALAEPGVAVIVLTPSETDERVLAALRAGASAVVIEDRGPGDLVRAVTLGARGFRLGSRRPRRVRRCTAGAAPRPLALATSSPNGGEPWSCVI
jgi:DNA-binding NarL/FixJ family response regulator